jgi:hypothetical protein
VFRYSYDWRSSVTSKNPAYGVIHGEQTKIWFGAPLSSDNSDNDDETGGEIYSAVSLRAAKEYTDEERRFSKQLIKYWTNFMKHGDPNVYDKHDKTPKNVYWPHWVEASWSKPIANNPYGSYISLKPKDLNVTSDVSFLKCEFWRPYSNFPSFQPSNPSDSKIDERTGDAGDFTWAAILAGLVLVVTLVALVSSYAVRSCGKKRRSESVTIRFDKTSISSVIK